MQNENQPLYCFRIDEESGEILSYKLTDYSKRCISSYTHRNEFRFDGKLIGCSVKNITILREENIGRYVNGKVFLYENDIEKARSIALTDIKNRLDKARTDAIRYEDFYNKLSKGD